MYIQFPKIIWRILKICQFKTSAHKGAMLSLTLSFFKLIFTGVHLIYNVLFSAVQQSQSVIHMHTSILFFFSLILFLNFTILYQFCQTSKWIHHRYTCAPHPEPSSFLDSIPIKVITEYWVEFPVLYSRFLKVIYFIYSSVQMSIPISQVIPLPFLPW